MLTASRAIRFKNGFKYAPIAVEFLGRDGERLSVARRCVCIDSTHMLWVGFCVGVADGIVVNGIKRVLL